MEKCPNCGSKNIKIIYPHLYICYSCGMIYQLSLIEELEDD